MSSSWRNIFTYNKYAQITARALRASLKEDYRVASEKRGLTSLKYQQWENGLGGTQVLLKDAEENNKENKAR
ncbi:Mitochondrial ATP synthase epsilon chain domain containing protein [Amanita muscaria]|uniref:Uncharacterized protein n=1 Tax=Amanita muscaria (strain Koide BX008) TaxID=946122 RepID=A0A0C2T694_AMAMK|nr:hypothetical protein M378DRAFT_166230 [Amanita muscaria Koide BX008]